MTEDLERSVAELGEDYRAVVGRLEKAYREQIPARPRRAWLGAACLSAAAILVFLAGGLTVSILSSDVNGGVPGASVVSEYQLAMNQSESAIKEIIRTQNADGSWKTDFLTRQNAAALRTCGDPQAFIAYKKAVRNLTRRGVAGCIIPSCR